LLLQLPRRLVGILAGAGHDAVHTSWLPDQNRTKDGTFRRLADAEGRIAMTKDADFVTSHLLLASPAKQLRVSLETCQRNHCLRSYRAI